MVNNKLVINSTQIPNYILDEMMPLLTDTEFKVLMIVCRQTYGWHKEADRISYSQLKEKTGASNGSIANALRSLREQGLIIVLDEKGHQLFTKEECRGKELFYKIGVTSPKIGDHLSKNRTSKIGDTKETYTKDVFNKLNTSGDKSPKGHGNNFVNLILKDFSEVTGLQQPADKDPRRAGWNFHQKYGASNFRPALEYLQGLWKKDITKIETVKLHYPTYQRDVLKVSASKLTKEQQEIAELLGGNI